MTTYTNLGIKQIDTGAEAGTWGTSTNTNFDYFDQAIVGYAEITLTTAGSTGTPNLLEVLDYAPSDGRSRVIEFTSASDLGGDAYVQISPNDFRGYYFVRNSLPGSRSVILFQGNWDAGRDFELTAGADTVVICTGAGPSASKVENFLSGLQTGGIVTGNITGDTITATTEFVGPGDGLTGTASGLTVGTSTNSTNSTNVAVTNDISSGGVYYPTFVINTVGNLGVRTSSTKLTYQPSTGTFTSTILATPTANITTGNITTGNITTGNITTLNVSGNIAYFSGTGAVDITAGTTAQRPASPTGGMIRYNTTTGYYEVYTASGWVNLATGGAGLGDGQTWQNLAGSRTFDTAYLNTAGRTIAVSVSAYGSSGASTGAQSISAYVGGTFLGSCGTSESTVGTWYAISDTLFFIVPAGQYYQVNKYVNGGVTTLNAWAELR